MSDDQPLPLLDEWYATQNGGRVLSDDVQLDARRIGSAIRAHTGEAHLLDRVHAYAHRMGVVVLVPRRSDGGHRDRVWAHCRSWWETEFEDWPIFEGEAPEGVFNRSAAINRAADSAGVWDVAVIIDADVIPDAAGVRHAVNLAAVTGAVANGHDERVMLTRQATRRALDAKTVDLDDPRNHETIWLGPRETFSCVTVVPRGLWDQIGGFDARFVGWGHEDWAFREACETFSGHPVIRLSTRLYHLWHEHQPSAPPHNPTRELNRLRYERYAAVRGDREAMLEVIRSE